MNGKIYIATSLNNAQRANELQKRFRDAGCDITYDWTVHGQVYTEAELIRVGIAEERGVADADVLFMMFPARVGTHFEMGLARGLGTKIVMLFDKQDTRQLSFYYLSGIERFTNEDDAVNHTLEFLDKRKL